MNYGLYLSANGISSTQHRMNVLANNLANANTTGFKPSAVVLGERAREPQQLNTLTNSSQLLKQLGGGTEIAYTGLDLRQGSLEKTGIRTNLAIKGSGFLHLDGGRDGARNLTRDGNLTFDPSGILRHEASGHAVLDERGNQIQLNGPEQRRFDGFGPNGELLDADDPFGNLGRVALVDAPPLSLTPRGQNLIETREDLSVASDAQVVGSTLEQSAANPVSGMVELIKLTRQIEMNSRMMQYQDAMIGQAVTALARVV